MKPTTLLKDEMEEISAIIKKCRFPLEREKEVQAKLGEVMFDNKIPFVREYFLDENSEPDFMVKDGIVLEVKIKGSRLDIYRQIYRYSLHKDVKGVILLTNKSIGEILLSEGKPFLSINLSNAWL